MSAISIKDLSKTYPPSFPRLKRVLRMPVSPPVEALRNVSLEVGEGEIVGLIGKNGAGKTTLTKIIATLVGPTSGTVSVHGRDVVADDAEVRSMIGLATAEERSFYWRLTAEQNLLFFARLYGMNDRAARESIGSLLERLELAPLARRRFAELSTGNKQRLAVARALLQSPPVLLLDEPTRSLDPIAASGMRSLIASLEGVTVLLTSHNLSEIEELCARVAIISNGEIRAVGSPAELRRSHRETQAVTITFASGDGADLARQFDAARYSVVPSNGVWRMSFTREPGDDLLGSSVAALAGAGARIIDIETEEPTLLDVLESYE